MGSLFVIPKPGLVVRDPANGYRQIPADGCRVPRVAYWLRRIASGDVTEGVPAKATPAPVESSDKKKDKRK